VSCFLQIGASSSVYPRHHSRNSLSAMDSPVSHTPRKPVTRRSIFGVKDGLRGIYIREMFALESGCKLHSKDTRGGCFKRCFETGLFFFLVRSICDCPLEWNYLYSVISVPDCLFLLGNVSYDCSLP